jgi:transposase
MTLHWRLSFHMINPNISDTSTLSTSGICQAYKLFVGIDVAATSATVAWLAPDEVGASSNLIRSQPKSKKGVEKGIIVEQSYAGFAKLQRQLAATGVPAASALVVMEATGNYWINLAVTLHHAGYAVSVINPSSAHHFAQAQLKRAKTDALDAYTLAQLAQALRPPVWTPPPQVYHELAQRLNQRQSLLDMRQQLRNQLHALRAGAVVIPAVAQRMEELISTLDEQIRAVEAEMADALAMDEAWASSIGLLLTITGIGLITALWLVVATLNFGSCSNVEEVTAYAGLAPQPHQSGSSVHGRASIGHSGHSRLRSALYLATLSAGQHNAIIAPFYERLVAKGKPKKVARCVAARKLLHIAWAVATKKQPFDANHINVNHTKSKTMQAAAVAA